jgi:hypothetical protein
VRKTLGEFLGALSDEVAKEVGFEAQPKPFDGIEIGAVARQVMNLEVMPVEDRPNSGSAPVGEGSDAEESNDARHGCRVWANCPLENRL